jgi:hypothetical protein
LKFQFIFRKNPSALFVPASFPLIYFLSANGEIHHFLKNGRTNLLIAAILYFLVSCFVPYRQPTSLSIAYSLHAHTDHKMSVLLLTSYSTTKPTTPLFPSTNPHQRYSKP